MFPQFDAPVNDEVSANMNAHLALACTNVSMQADFGKVTELRPSVLALELLSGLYYVAEKD